MLFWAFINYVLESSNDMFKEPNDNLFKLKKFQNETFSNQLGHYSSNHLFVRYSAQS